MDAVDIRRDDDLGATIIEVAAAITYGDILEIAREGIAPSQTRHLIWIVHPGAAGKLTTDDFKHFYASHRSMILARQGGHTVYVAPEDAENALCRWAQVYVERVADVPIGIHVVRTLDEAYDILTQANAESNRTDSVPKARLA